MSIANCPENFSGQFFSLFLVKLILVFIIKEAAEISAASHINKTTAPLQVNF